MRLRRYAIALIGCTLLFAGGAASGCAVGPAPGGAGGGAEEDETLFDPGTGSSCADAAASRSYIGCDFWPTVTANPVWSVFDYAVVVANGGPTATNVEVTRGDAVLAEVTIAAGSLETIYLPWVAALKSPGEADACYRRPAFQGSVFADDGAYHLVSTSPVTVYQFSALEYRGKGGPTNKDWSDCPGHQVCDLYGYAFGCFSFSNDASLLLPSAAMTGTYRVATTTADDKDGGFLTVTATADDTVVVVQLSGTAAIVGGGGIDPVERGGGATLRLHRGDVVQLIGTPGSDFSGTLVSADKPVQVLAGMPCLNVPLDTPACDHIEETVLPAETLGAHYFVTRPTGPNGTEVGHVVRIYGNFDGTTLSYPDGAPAGAPSRIDAGDVIDLGIVDRDFEVVGSQAFAVASFMLGGSIVDADAVVGEQRGDPAQSAVTAVEQYRSQYVFLAPDDYDRSFVDVVQPLDATLTLDGQAITLSPRAIGDSGFGITRLQLGKTTSGAHALSASAPVGLQVAGYGAYTSYYYPGGLDLKEIAPPPVK